jgi:hypothetical protein
MPYSSSSIVVTSLQLRHWKVRSFGSPPSLGMTEASCMVLPANRAIENPLRLVFRCHGGRLSRARKDAMTNLKPGGARDHGWLPVWRAWGVAWGVGGAGLVAMNAEG